MNLYYSLFLGFIICYSIAIPIDKEGKSSLISRHGEHSIRDDQIIGIKNSLIGGLLTKTINEQKLRRKRDNSDSVDIKAIQATINDHRTMIEDNRIMISNIINNPLNNISIQQAISNHYSYTAPIWNSWRDIVLIFLSLVSIVQIIYYCACQVKLRPYDYFLSRLFQRYDTRQSQKERPLFPRSTINNNTNMLSAQKHLYPSILPKSSVKTVEDDYADIHQNDTLTDSTKKN